MKNEETLQKLDWYQKMSKGLPNMDTLKKVAEVSLSKTALPVVALAACAMPLSAVAQCGTAGSVSSSGSGGANGGPAIDINGGGNDFTFYNNGGNQIFLKRIGSFSFAYSGTRNGGYPIVVRIPTTSSPVMPGAFNWTNGQNSYGTMLDDNATVSALQWRAGDDGYIPIRLGTGGTALYGFIRVSITNPYTGGGDINLNASDSGLSSSTGNVTVGDCPGIAGGGAPVELTSFIVGPRLDYIHLEWATATESNNAGFEVQRSMDGKNFQKITFILGHGSTIDPHQYSFDDKQARPNQIYYYRLRQVDIDGQFEFSPTITARIEGAGTQASEFYPNPSQTGLTKLDFSSHSSEPLTISIYNSTGKELFRTVEALSDGNNTLEFDLAHLGTGVFFAKIEQNSAPIYKKLILK